MRAPGGGRTAEQPFWVIDAARDRAGAAQVIRSITAFSEEVTEDRGGLGVAGVVLFDLVDEGLLELVGELCGGGRRVLGVALPDGALSGDAAWSLLGAGLSDVTAVGRLRRRGATATGALGARRSARCIGARRGAPDRMQRGVAGSGARCGGGRVLQ